MKKSLVSLIVILVITACLRIDHALAQEPDLVHQVECLSEFPTCKIYLSARTLGADPTQASVEVYVDGEQQEIMEISRESRAIQVLFAFDEYTGQTGVTAPGLSGQPMYVEFRQAAASFFNQLGQLDRPDDVWLAAYRTGTYTPDTSTVMDFPAIVDWVSGNTLNLFHNTFSDYQTDPQKTTPETSFYALIRANLARFQEAGAPQESARHMILFTNGYESANDAELNQLLAEAQAQQVRIHTVMLISPEVSDDHKEAYQARLLTISRATGGQFAVFTGTSDLDGIWQSIIGDLRCDVIRFTLTDGDAEQIEVVVDGVREWEGLQLPALAPPEITIISPAHDALIEPDSAESRRQLAVSLDIQFPDGYGDAVNRLAAIEYSVDGQPIHVQETAPYTQVVFESDKLRAGSHTLTVRVVDRFTGPVELRPVPFELKSTAVLPLLWLAPVPILLVGGWLLYRSFRKDPTDQKVEWSSEPVDDEGTEPEEDGTEPFVDTEVFPAASLILERGDGELPEKIELYPKDRGQAPNQWKVGRSRQYSDKIIDSKRVSRLHATILEQNGQFRLRDEGSAGGTYLNKRRLEPQMPEVLAHGDLINFNIVAYRFMIEDIMSAPSSRPARTQLVATGDGDATEVERIDPLFDA